MLGLGRHHSGSVAQLRRKLNVVPYGVAKERGMQAATYIFMVWTFGRR